MPVLLKKPFSVGDLDPNQGEGYKFAQLSALYHNGITFSITLEWQFGTASGDYYENWQRGPGSPTKSVDVPGSQVVPLWGQKPNEGESIGEAIRRVTYQFLIDQGYIDGEIVNNPPLPPQAEATVPAEGKVEPNGDDTPAQQPASESPEPEASSSPNPEPGTTADSGSTPSSSSDAPEASAK